MTQFYGATDNSPFTYRPRGRRAAGRNVGAFDAIFDILTQSSSFSRTSSGGCWGGTLSVLCMCFCDTSHQESSNFAQEFKDSSENRRLLSVSSTGTTLHFEQPEWARKHNTPTYAPFNGPAPYDAPTPCTTTTRTPCTATTTPCTATATATATATTNPIDTINAGAADRATPPPLGIEKNVPVFSRRCVSLNACCKRRDLTFSKRRGVSLAAGDVTCDETFESSLSDPSSYFSEIPIHVPYHYGADMRFNNSASSADYGSLYTEQIPLRRVRKSRLSRSKIQQIASHPLPDFLDELAVTNKTGVWLILISVQDSDTNESSAPSSTDILDIWDDTNISQYSKVRQTTYTETSTGATCAYCQVLSTNQGLHPEKSRFF
ncbi:CIC11C00000005843 [Sungouiella intermedia]|uniref:CIC11C00000005843 n=1 Tax=Sungouiella intermedia TaxID=45354 RepID=A0A1L0BSZ5_9ASCO|nr:CIC11C00000005843 [[Candida] intermedia]